MILLSLAGCLFVSDAELTAFLDHDGDGYDNRALGGTDCDDENADVGEGALYRDSDGDDLGDPATAAIGCEPRDGWADNADDCDDTDAAIGTATTWYRDGDGDGYGDPDLVEVSCTAEEGWVDNAEDCDDSSAVRGAPVTNHADVDGDGYGDPDDVLISCVWEDGWASNGRDCDDTNAAVNPGALEWATEDGTDYDCDGITGDARLDNVGLVFMDEYEAGETGTAVAGVGDTNRDGFDDVAIGIPGYRSGGQVRFGQGTDHVGEEGDLQVVPLSGADTWSAGATDDELGRSLAVGDLTDDGLDDLLIGAPGAVSGAGYVGVAASPFPLSVLTFESAVYGSEAGGRFGSAVTTAHIPGARERALVATAPEAGRIYVVPGPFDGREASYVDDIASATFRLSPEGDLDTNIAVSAGDLDGDGGDELYIGARWQDGARTNSGSVWACGPDQDGSAFITSACDAEISGDTSNQGAGAALAVFDADGDGYDDLLVGSPGTDGRAADVGAVYLFLGGAIERTGTILTSAADTTFLGEPGRDDVGEAAGSAVSSAGDLDGNGVTDIAIGAPDWDDPHEGADVGAVYFALGPHPSGTVELSGVADRFVCSAPSGGDYAGCRAGSTLAPAGDVDADGIPDTLVGAPGYRWNGDVETGAAIVVFGKNVY